MGTRPVREYRSHFPSSRTSASAARRAIINFASAWLRADALTELEFAVGEALANAVLHGHKEGASIEVHCWQNDGVIYIEITDSGEGFDPSSVMSATVPPLMQTRGWGSFIMRAFTDEMMYGNGGKRLRLAKRI
jgi:anti-sigma regulatory factor (Ser/Thr protein kinase)